MATEYAEGLGTPSGEVVDMIITNETAYYAWNTEWNGVKRPSEGAQTDSDAFFVVNLLGPREEGQAGSVASWRAFSYVQLKVQFVTGTARTPLQVPRTYLTFYDFDTGQPQFEGSQVQVETMWADTAPHGIAYADTASPTELITYNTFEAFITAMGISSTEIDAFFTTEERQELNSWQPDSNTGAGAIYSATPTGWAKTTRLTRTR